MEEISRIILPVGNGQSLSPQSLHWQDNELIDWLDGGTRYGLDGSHTDSDVNFAYRFDQAHVSPDGQYVALVERLGTKGLLLKDRRILREINRTFYFAHRYGHSFIFLPLPGERTGIAHCPNRYYELEIEDVETGERIATPNINSLHGGLFHSRLSISPDGRFLASAGWQWHPLKEALLLDVRSALERPNAIAESTSAFGAGVVLVNMAVFIANDSLVLTTMNHFDDDELPPEDADLLQLKEIGVYDMPSRKFRSKAPLEEDAYRPPPHARQGHRLRLQLSRYRCKVRRDDAHLESYESGRHRLANHSLSGRAGFAGVECFMAGVLPHLHP